MKMKKGKEKTTTKGKETLSDVVVVVVVIE